MQLQTIGANSGSTKTHKQASKSSLLTRITSVFRSQAPEQTIAFDLFNDDCPELNAAARRLIRLPNKRRLIAPQTLKLLGAAFALGLVGFGLLSIAAITKFHPSTFGLR